MHLRPYVKDDAPIICTWIETEEELYRWSADRFGTFPLRAEDLEENYARQAKEGRFHPLTAIDDEGNVIGHFVIRHPRANDESSVRFGCIIVDPKARGKGYGKALLLHGIRYAREALGANRIELSAFTNNDSARRCYEAVGFRQYDERERELPVGTWTCRDMEIRL